jgi:hypothetical protein
MSRKQKSSKKQDEKTKNQRTSCLFCGATGSDPKRTTKTRLIHLKDCPLLEVDPLADPVPEIEPETPEHEADYF